MPEKTIPVAVETVATPPATGCGGCAVKSIIACTSHLTGAALAIAAAFKENETIFDRDDPEHIGIATAILEGHIKDDSGNHVPYEFPTEPNVREKFLSKIQEQFTAATNG